MLLDAQPCSPDRYPAVRREPASRHPPDTPERARQSFDAVPHQALFVGHFHRWFLVTPDEAVSWYGEQPIALEPDRRYLIGVHAVVNGRYLIYDTKARVLTPFDH